jgi:D-glutamate cyclase
VTGGVRAQEADDHIAEATLSAARTIDRLTNLDFPMRGVIAALHGEARRLMGGPLCHGAAREILARVPDGGVVAILTGFPEFPWIRRGVAETDGPVGAAVLARSLLKARRAIPILPCEPHFAPMIEAAVRGIGLVPIPAAGLDLATLHPGDPVCLIEATDEPVDAVRWLESRAPSLVIAIERPGRGATGVYHSMSGYNVSHCLNNFEDLFVAAGARSIWTIGIGDGGNEVGMGALRDVVRTQVAAGAACGCGCGGGIAAVSPSASLVTAVVANFGATAIAAMLALLTDDRDVLPPPDLELRSLEACVAAGAVDGQHNECVMSVDGLAAGAYGAVLELIADAVDRARRRRRV